MGIQSFWFIWMAMVLAWVSTMYSDSQTVDEAGCSLAGVDFQQCFVPSNTTPFSLESCCTALNRAVEAGFYCLCSLLGPSNYPVFSAQLEVSFSTCYITMPSLSDCHEIEPVVIGPPMAAAAPKLMRPQPEVPPRDDQILPEHPKVHEPSNYLTNGTSHQPNPLRIPQRWDCLSSDGPSFEILMMFKTTLLAVEVLPLFIMIA